MGEISTVLNPLPTAKQSNLLLLFNIPTFAASSLVFPVPFTGFMAFKCPKQLHPFRTVQVAQEPHRSGQRFSAAGVPPAKRDRMMFTERNSSLQKEHRCSLALTSVRMSRVLLCISQMFSISCIDFCRLMCSIHHVRSKVVSTLHWQRYFNFILG